MLFPFAPSQLVMFFKFPKQIPTNKGQISHHCVAQQKGVCVFKVDVKLIGALSKAISCLMICVYVQHKKQSIHKSSKDGVHLAVI